MKVSFIIENKLIQKTDLEFMSFRRACNLYPLSNSDNNLVIGSYKRSTSYLLFSGKLKINEKCEI